MARTIGVLFILAGLVALLYGGFAPASQPTTAVAGSHLALVDNQQWPVPPLAGAIALGAGVIFFLLSFPRARARDF